MLPLSVPGGGFGPVVLCCAITGMETKKMTKKKNTAFFMLDRVLLLKERIKKCIQLIYEIYCHVGIMVIKKI